MELNTVIKVTNPQTIVSLRPNTMHRDLLLKPSWNIPANKQAIKVFKLFKRAELDIIANEQAKLIFSAGEKFESDNFANKKTKKSFD